jgi:hypothetical protein
MAFSPATAAFTKAEMDVFIPEIWAPIVHDWKAAPMSILNFATDLSYLLEGGGDVINVPNIYTNVFTVSTQSTEGAGVVDQSPAPDNTTLTVNTHAYVAFVIGKKTMKQVASQYKLSEKYAGQARDLIVASIESALFALVSSLTTTDVGTGLVAVNDLTIRQAIGTLQDTDGAVFELSDMAFFFHPTVFYNQLMGISKYYELQKSGMAMVKEGNFGAGAVNGSFKGRLYDIDMYTSARVPVATTVVSNMLLHKEAFAFAMHTSGENGLEIATDYLTQNLAWLTVVDAIYGVSAIRTNAGVTILADSEETVNA